MSAPSCVLLADPHHGLTEGLCGLLETSFGVVVMVADTPSLLESAKRLNPTLAVVDRALGSGADLSWLAELHRTCPDMKFLVISPHDASSLCRRVLAAGASGFILMPDLATELLPAVDQVLAGWSYVPKALASPIGDEIGAAAARQPRVCQ